MLVQLLTQVQTLFGFHQFSHGVQFCEISSCVCRFEHATPQSGQRTVHHHTGLACDTPQQLHRSPHPQQHCSVICHCNGVASTLLCKWNHTVFDFCDWLFFMHRAFRSISKHICKQTLPKNIYLLLRYIFTLKILVITSIHLSMVCKYFRCIYAIVSQ